MSRRMVAAGAFLPDPDRDWCDRLTIGYTDGKTRYGCRYHVSRDMTSRVAPGLKIKAQVMDRAFKAVIAEVGR